MEQWEDFEMELPVCASGAEKNSAPVAILVAGVTAVGVVAAGLALKKWGAAKFLGGVALPFVIKDSIEAFEQSRDKTYRYMKEHKNGKHYIKLS